MTISVRRVSPDWKHPVDGSGKYLRILDESYSYKNEEYSLRKTMWEMGIVEEMIAFDGVPKFHWVNISSKYKSFEDCYGTPPSPGEFRTDWERVDCTCYQLYNAQLNTPCSAVYETAKDLAQYCRQAIKNGTLYEWDFATLYFPHSVNLDLLEKKIEECASKLAHYKK